MLGYFYLKLVRKYDFEVEYFRLILVNYDSFFLNF